MAEDRFMVKRLHNNIIDRDGKPEFIENILNSGKNCVNGLNDSGQTPLIACVHEGFIRPEKRDKMEQMMKLFLGRPECNVNATDSRGRTALMWAACANYWDGAAELLLADPRTDFNYTSNKMETALDLARQWEFHWLVKVLTKHQNEGTKPTAVATPYAAPGSSSAKSPAFGALPPLPPSSLPKTSISSSLSGVPPPPPPPGGVTPPGSGKSVSISAPKYSASNTVTSTYNVPKPSSANVNADEKRVIQLKKLLNKIADQYHNLETDISLAKLESSDAQVIEKIAALYGTFDAFMTQCEKDPSLA